MKFVIRLQKSHYKSASKNYFEIVESDTEIPKERYISPEEI